MTRRQGWLAAGLFFATFATLLVEILDSRLLSVVAFYHLSFFAVSIAMLGMAAGAVAVFVGGDRFRGERALAAAPQAALALAFSIPLGNLLCRLATFPQLNVVTWDQVLKAAGFLVVLSLPFFFSGVVVALALTRMGGRIGRLYAADLVGAAAGCMLVIPLLNYTEITSAACVAGLFGAASAYSFARFAGRGPRVASLATAAVLVVAAVGFSLPEKGFFDIRTKFGTVPLETVAVSRWNDHSHVLAIKPIPSPRPFMWAPGDGLEEIDTNIVIMTIDGGAGTGITQWDGDVGSLSWAAYDVTYLPYHIRTGDVAVIGVGGGRDLLAALHSGAASVVGVELNGVLVDLLEGPFRDYAKLADRPDVELVHDEARSYLSRATRKFDVVQMSLIDTWAATGAGAFTLSENGLYTMEGWDTFLDLLKEGGVLSVSRWFSPKNVTETHRLLALGVASLLERGVEDPTRQLLLVARDTVATLLVSNRPFTESDAATVRDVAEARGFQVLAAPWAAPEAKRMREIVQSRTVEELERATADRDYDYSPPTDARPYFFNMLKPTSFLKGWDSWNEGVIAGNIKATTTLIVLIGVSAALVLLVILGPLLARGLPQMERGFARAVAYFSLIGFGFMGLQFGLLQRFSVYLGRPTYSLAVILFTMILCAGLGSALSDRVHRLRGNVLWIPLGIAAGGVVVMWLLRWVVPETMGFPLAARILVVVAITAPLSVPLGMCFPLGLRLVERHSRDAGAWMWGVNGAFSVFGSCAAVATALWLGIEANLWIGVACYVALTLPMAGLVRLQASAA